VRFIDNKDVQITEHGQLDNAHFVQVMDGHILDRKRADELERAGDEMLAKARPDLLGTVTAYFDDGEYTAAAYFTSEAEAREGERKEMPAEVGADFAEWERVMKVDKYLDITEPWLVSA